MKKLSLDDLYVGQRFCSESETLSAEAIIRFARDNDPQFFHLDEEAAKDSMFEGLVASGWQTAALALRLLLGTMRLAKGTVGADAHISWRRPVRPGDTLRIEAVITAIRRSRSKPDRGFVTIDLKLLNQSDEPVQRQRATIVAFSEQTVFID